MLGALADGSVKTIAEVAAETGVAPSTIRSTLSRAARSGEVSRTEDGYQLVVSDDRLP